MSYCSQFSMTTPVLHNYTKLVIRVQTHPGEFESFVSEGFADVDTALLNTKKIGDFELRHVEYGSVQGLPVEREGHFCIVSVLALIANQLDPVPRKDLIAPDSGHSAIRDEKTKQIIAVTGFITL